ncbi:MAG TPA: cation diffusion facilitator family transporter [Candidatus Binatus sp.]|nr:cation diffusion facilitator family transporter [Candidatus Binatus sp.]
MHEETGFIKGERIARISVITLAALGIIEIVFSQLSGSIALFADGVDSLSDAGVAFFVWMGLRLALKRPSKRFQFGYYKVESLTALLTAVALIGIAAYIMYRSYRALLHPTKINLPSIALIILFGAGSVSLYRALQMRQIANRYNILSLKVSAQNSIKDTSASFIAFISVSAAAEFGLIEMDAIGGLIVGIYILTVAYVAIREASLVLLDAFHEPELTREIESLIQSYSHIRGITDLRLRRAGPFIVGQLKVMVDGDMTVREMHKVLSDLETSVKNRIAGLRSLTVEAVPAN